MRFLALVLLSVLFLTVPAQAAVIGKPVVYKDGEVELEGYLAFEETTSALQPGLLLLPEWWGNNDYVKRRARELAADGYVVFVADMYGKGLVTRDPKQAGEWATPFYQNRGQMHDRAMAGLAVLRNQVNVDKNNLAALGFCFGGTVALELARAGENLKGVAVFHGGLESPTKVEKGTIKAKILVLNGAADPMVPFAQRQAFIEEMQNAGADLQFIEYGHALHAFTNPDADAMAKAGLKGVGYNEKAEKRSFAAFHQFLDEIFKRPAL